MTKIQNLTWRDRSTPGSMPKDSSLGNVWVIGNCFLEFICNLVLGIWDFIGCHTMNNDGNLSNQN
jgi:hypothetical protein